MLTPQQKQFISKLESISGSRSIYKSFSSFLEIAAIYLHQLPYNAGLLLPNNTSERLEANYFKTIKPYNKSELQTFAELIDLTIEAHRNIYRDFLGEIAGELGSLSKKCGQFFTPYAICNLMARTTCGNIKQQLESKDIITVHEPAVGAGATLIAIAEEVTRQGIDPCRHLQFDCTDIDRDAFNMTYIQLSNLGLQAIVRHGNTLSDEYWESRATAQMLLFNQQRRTPGFTQIMRSLFAQHQTEEAVIVTDEQSAPTADTLFDLETFSGSNTKEKKVGRRKYDITINHEQMSLFE